MLTYLKIQRSCFLVLSLGLGLATTHAQTLTEDSPISYGDVQIKILPSNPNFKDWLQPGVIDKNAKALSSKPNFLYFSQNILRLPLKVPPLSTLFYNGSKVDPLLTSAIGLYIVSLPIQNPEECFDFVVTSRDNRSEDFEICLKISDSKMAYLGGRSGPFHFRKDFSYWGQLGGSLVTQAINNKSSSSSAGSAKQIAARMGGGFLYKNFELESFFRGSLYNLGTTQIRPLWVQGSFGYSFELPSFHFGFKNVIPRILLLSGLDYYQNSVAKQTSNTPFIKQYAAPFFGFRSRFVMTTRLEVGGDFFYSIVQNGRKFFIQGDLRYWFSKEWALGAGYWLDSATFASDGFDEKNYAAETLLRYAF